MNNMNASVTIRLFGALRDLHRDALLEIPLEEPCRAEVLRELVGFRLQELNPRVPAEDITRLLHSSAMATESRLLDEAASIEPGAKLALLPPVCGG